VESGGCEGATGSGLEEIAAWNTRKVSLALCRVP
jgi:hypothetical protein